MISYVITAWLWWPHRLPEMLIDVSGVMSHCDPSVEQRHNLIKHEPSTCDKDA